jgi:hypothetical protein
MYCIFSTLPVTVLYFVANKIILDYPCFQIISDTMQFSSRAETTMRARNVTGMLLVILLLSLEAQGRRGRGRSRPKSRMQIGLPITGKYRDQDSDQYYNNSDVSS